jgi:hypothetical protein
LSADIETYLSTNHPALLPLFSVAAMAWFRLLLATLLAASSVLSAPATYGTGFQVLGLQAKGIVNLAYHIQQHGLANKKCTLANAGVRKEW